MHLQLDSTQALRFTPHSLTRYSHQSPWQLLHRPPRLLLQSTVMQRHCRNYSTRSPDKQENMTSKSFALRLSTTHTHGKGRRFQLRKSKLSSNPTSQTNTALALQSFKKKTRRNYNRCCRHHLEVHSGEIARRQISFHSHYMPHCY